MKTAKSGWVFALAIVLGLVIGAGAMAPPRSMLTLVVIPERYSVVQVAMDLEHTRSVVLVSYRGGSEDASEVRLHAWDGSAWIPISTESFSQATFLRVPPRRAVLVGDESLLPRVLVDGVGWCSQVWQVPSVRTDDLVNSFGKIFSFRKSEWEWFAGRYKLDLEDLHQDVRKDSWYFHPYIEDSVEMLPRAEADSDLVSPVAQEPDPAEVMEIEDLVVQEEALDLLPAAEAAPLRDTLPPPAIETLLEE